ncbi:hypothetical protein DXG01_001262, partial [Tephrocybe rancida]
DDDDSQLIAAPLDESGRPRPRPVKRGKGTKRKDAGDDVQEVSDSQEPTAPAVWSLYLSLSASLTISLYRLRFPRRVGCSLERVAFP